jgi:hypothetical protein
MTQLHTSQTFISPGLSLSALPKTPGGMPLESHESLLIRRNQKKHPRQDQGPGDQNPITRVIRRYLNEFGHRFAVLHFDRKLGLQRSLVEAIIGRIMDHMVPIGTFKMVPDLANFPSTTS